MADTLGLPAPDGASFMMSLGGQGNAAGWTVVAAGRLPVPDATHGRAARTVLVVTWGCDVAAVHRLVGTSTTREYLGEIEVGEAPLRLEHPAVSVEVPGVPAGRWRAWLEVHAADPDGFLPGANADHLMAVVTLWIRLVAADAPGVPEAPVLQAGAALALYLNELGFVLCDQPRVDRVLVARRGEVEAAGGILEAIGSTSLGEELLDDGAFFPIWGMRPWLYRIASGGTGPVLCPLGHEVAGPVTFRTAGFTSGMRVVPGDSLQGATAVDWDRWPLLALPGHGEGLQIGTFVSGGPEPIDPDHAVGIVPTTWLERTTTVPEGPNSARYTLTDYNPLEQYPMSAAPERASWSGLRWPDPPTGSPPRMSEG